MLWNTLYTIALQVLVFLKKAGDRLAVIIDSLFFFFFFLLLLQQQNTGSSTAELALGNSLVHRYGPDIYDIESCAVL